MSAEPEAPRGAPALAPAVAAVVALIAVAVFFGAGAARMLRAAPTPRPTPSPEASAPSPAPPDTGPLVFAQPLSAGCVAGGAAYVVSDGGGIGRYADERWQLIDTTARTLHAATCRGDEAIAVGGSGRVVTIDDQARTIRPDSVQLDDLYAVAPLPGGLLAAGARGSVMLQQPSGWAPYAQGIDEDLRGIAAFSLTSAWAVGTGGASYRLEADGWRPVPTGVTSDLRAIAARSVDDVIAAGDDGVVLAWAGRWKRVEAGLPAGVQWRAALRIADLTYLAGDRGTLVRLRGASSGDLAIEPVALGADGCTLRALFTRANDEVWVIGSDGGRAAVWRLGRDGAQRWGDCP